MMPTQGEALLAIGAGPEQVPAIRVAQRLGFRVVATDRDAAAPGLALADTAHTIDIADEAAVVELARTVLNLRGVLPAPIGRLLTTVGAVNDALGLRGVTREAAFNCTDKTQFHRVAHAAGLPRPDYAVIDDVRRLDDAARRIGFPLVVKPAHGSGSRGVEVLMHARDLPAAATRLRALGRHPILVETMVPGPEYGIDGYVERGRFVLVLVRRKYVTPLPWRQETGYDAPAPITTELERGIAADLQRAVDAIRLDACLVHADVVVPDGGRPMIIEMSGRPSALSISDHVVPASTGVAFTELGIHLATGQSVGVVPVTRVPVCLRFVPAPAGLVTRAPTLPAPAGDVLSATCALRPGDELLELRHAADALARGLVITTGRDIESAAARADAIADEIATSLQMIPTASEVLA